VDHFYSWRLAAAGLAVRLAGMLIVCAMVGACTSLRDGAAQAWPGGLPPVTYFEEVYAKDRQLRGLQSLEDYLSWVRSFYQGAPLYPRGWNDISEDLLAAADDPAQRAQRERKLYTLGRDIAAEWSKANSVRAVNAGHLSIWSVAAGRAVKEDSVDETLDAIIADLQRLLAGELLPDAITANRYHEPDQDDWFAR